MRRSLSLAVLWCLATSAPARGDDLVINPTVDGIVIGAGAVGYFVTETFFKARLAPSRCRWCDEPLNSVDSGIRDALVWDNTSAANTLSNVSGFVLVPLSSFGLLALTSTVEGKGQNRWTDAIIVLEAAVLTADLNQLVKMSTGRVRPFVRWENGLDPNANKVDYNLSFYSGHASSTFAMATAAGTIATMRGYRSAPLIWATGLTLAATTGYFRIAADRHYFTDVLAGAIIGSATGFAVPYFLHRRNSPEVGITPRSVSVRLSF